MYLNRWCSHEFIRDYSSNFYLNGAKMEKEKDKKNIKDVLKLKKSGISEKISGKKDFLTEFISSAAKGEHSYGIFIDKLVNTVKVFIISTRKFLEDECLTKASSITYTIIVSLIPTLTVALTVYSVFSGVSGKKEELFRRISLFMAEHSIKLNIDPLFAAISNLVENAGKIGGISAAIMIFSATAMLRTLEKSLNDIWKIQQQRNFLLKIIYYWAALTLGPVMLVAGTTIAAQLSEIFSAPNYASAYITNDNNIWVAGSRSTIMQSADKKLHFASLKQEQIDFNNQKIYTYNSSTGGFQVQEYGIDPMEYRKTKFTDIQFIDETGWAVGNQGTVLQTTNGGKSWLLKRWGSFRFNDIHMLDRNTGFLAADNGSILHTDDGGKNWDVLEWEGVVNNFQYIGFYGKTGIITGSGGIILRTDDSGKTWNIEKIAEARKKERPVNLNSVFFINRDIIWLAGDEGILLKSRNGGKSWKTVKFKEINYNDIHFFNQNEGIAAGTRGTLISTRDGGENWTMAELPTYRINRLLVKNNRLWAIGDSGLVMVSHDNGKSWKGLEGKSIISFFINFFAPFAFIWLLFFLCYVMMPNTKVPFKEAAIGSAFTGAVWVAFILLFIVYVKAFAQGTFAIYGALASIPLFLLMVYASSVIILYGAEVSYTLMHPEIYRNLQRGLKERKEIHVYYGIAILQYIFRKFEEGKGGTDYKELTKLCVYNSEEVDFFVKKFAADRLIIQDNELGYIPANNSQNILLADIINTIHDISLSVPHGVKKSPLKEYMTGIFNDMGKSRNTIVGKITLNELIKKTS